MWLCSPTAIYPPHTPLSWSPSIAREAGFGKRDSSPSSLQSNRKSETNARRAASCPISQWSAPRSRPSVRSATAGRCRVDVVTILGIGGLGLSWGAVRKQPRLPHRRDTTRHRQGGALPQARRALLHRQRDRRRDAEAFNHSAVCNPGDWQVRRCALGCPQRAKGAATPFPRVRAFRSVRRRCRCCPPPCGLRAHGIATGRILCPNGRRKRERGDHRHTGQKMFHCVVLPCNLRGTVWVPTRPNSLFIVRRASGVKTAPARLLAGFTLLQGRLLVLAVWQPELRPSSRSRRIDGAAQRHLSVAHFYVHSQQRAHTEQWFSHRPGHDHCFYIPQNTGTDLKPPQPKKPNWVLGSISG